MTTFQIACARPFEVEARSPTKEELCIAWAAALDGGISHETAKSLCKKLLGADSDSWQRMVTRQPNGFRNLAAMIFEEAGLTAGITLLDEQELEGDIADAFVTKDADQKRLFKDPDDPRGTVNPLRVRYHEVESIYLITRRMRDAEVDDIRATTEGPKMFALYKRTAESMIVWGDTKALEAMPGLYFPIVAHAMMLVGDGDVVRLGK